MYVLVIKIKKVILGFETILKLFQSQLLVTRDVFIFIKRGGKSQFHFRFKVVIKGMPNITGKITDVGLGLKMGK